MTNARPKQTPFIVPVFIPHAGCPHRCIFCDQGATTGDAAAFPTAREVRRGITQFLSYRRDTTRPTEISFYGGNFLGLPPEQVQLLLATVAGYVQAGQADGIRFSTRPDTIDDRRLDWIRPFPVKTIEIGVQSMNDEALRLSGRGHTALDTERAFDVLAESAFRVGAQIMVGLPGDTHPAAMASARRLALLAPDFVRIYPTLVLRGSPLAKQFHAGTYTPLDLDTAVTQTADLCQIFDRHDIPVVRMGLQATEAFEDDTHLVAGPYHPAFGELVHSTLWQEAISIHLQREGLTAGDVLLEVNPRMLSQIKGPHDENIMGLIQRNGLQCLEVRANEAVPSDCVHVNGSVCRR